MIPERKVKEVAGGELLAFSRTSSLSGCVSRSAVAAAEAHRSTSCWLIIGLLNFLVAFRQNYLASVFCCGVGRSVAAVIRVDLPLTHQVARAMLTNEQLQQELQHHQEQQNQVEIVLKEKQDALDRASNMQQLQHEKDLQQRQQQEGIVQLPLA